MSAPLAGTAPAPRGSRDDDAEPSPFRSRRFVIFAIGNSLNNIGEAMYATALPLLVYRLTGSLGAMSLVASAVPVALLATPAFGVAVDRWGPRVLVVPGLLSQAAAALALILELPRAGTPAVFACALGVALGGVAYRTGWMTGVPAMFPDRPVRARGSLNSLFFTTMLAGPMIVTALLTQIGYTGLLWCDTATFFAPITVWALGIHPPRASGPGGPRAGQAAASFRLADGWHAIVSDTKMLAVLVAQISMGIAWGAGLTALLVFQLRSGLRLTATQASAALTGMNACLLAGNLLVAQRRRFRPRRPLGLGMAATTVALFTLTAAARPLFLAAACLGALGQGAVLSSVVMMRVKYLPQAVLGRASGLMWLLSGGAALLSPVITPALRAAAGPAGTFAVLGALQLSGLSFLLYSLHHRRADWPGAGPAPGRRGPGRPAIARTRDAGPGQ